MTGARWFGALVMATAVAAGAEPVLVAPAQQALLFQHEVRVRAAELIRMASQESEGISFPVALAAVRDDPALTPAARDAVLYAYVQELRKLPATAIPDAALDWLVEYQVQAVRRHDESAVAQVPLFNIAAAAQGLRHEKRYRIARKAMLAAESEDYPAWLVSYGASADRPWRSGVEAAVAELPRPALARVGELLDADPELVGSALAMQVRLLRSDVGALRSGVRSADSVIATETLRAAAQALPAADGYEIAESALAHTDAGVRGVAIAVASDLARADPRLRDAWQQRLFDLLDDANDGAAAALQLAKDLSVAELGGLAKRADDDRRLQPRYQLILRLRADMPQWSAEPEAWQ